MKIERKAANQKRTVTTIASSEIPSYVFDENRACMRVRLEGISDCNKPTTELHYDVSFSVAEILSLIKAALTERSRQLERSKELEALVLTKNACLRKIAVDTKMAYSASLNTAVVATN